MRKRRHAEGRGSKRGKMKRNRYRKEGKGREAQMDRQREIITVRVKKSIRGLTERGKNG